MSRLTKRNEHDTSYFIPECFEICDGLGCSEDCNNCHVEESIIEKLGAYEDAEEQGLLPRFHLGDEFWATHCKRVVKAKVVMLQQKKDGSWRYRLSLEVSENYHDTSDYAESDYGKYFFSAKEEAEKLCEAERKWLEEEINRIRQAEKKLESMKGE